MSSQLRAIVDKLLTNVSQAYIPDGYISEAIFPNLTVKQKTGKIGKYGNDHLRIVNAKMGGSAKAPRYEPIVRDSELYSIESYGLEGLVTEDDYANVEEPFSAEEDETVGLSTTLWTIKERGIGQVLFDTSVISQNITLSAASDKYSDYTNSRPLENFRDAQNTILDSTGVMPNRAIMSQKVFNTLKYHPAILRTLGYADNRAGTLSQAEIANALGVETLHVGNVSFNDAVKGQADSLTQAWTDSILMYHAPRTAAKYQQSLGYYMTMQGRGSRRVYKYAVDNPPNAKGIIVQDDYEFRLTNVNCGYLIKDAL